MQNAGKLYLYLPAFSIFTFHSLPILNNMKKYGILYLAILSFAACNNNTTDNTTTASSEPTKSSAALADGDYCYEKQEEEGVSAINLSVKGNIVTGIKAFSTGEEEDAVDGEIQATITGNEIKGTYSYAVDGEETVEDIMLKVDGDNLRLNVAEMEGDVGGRMTYKNPTEPAYNIVFNKASCMHLQN